MKLHRLAGFVLSTGALLALVGSSLGFGGQIGFGYALLPLALVLIAAGLIGRSVSTPSLPRWLVAMAAFGASFAVALAAMVVLYAFDGGPLGAAMEGLRRPAFVGFVVGAGGFCVAGMPGRHLPLAPAGLAAAGSLMLGAGVFGYEPVADVGLWLACAGWVALGALPWGDGAKSASRSPGHVTRHPA